MKYEHLIRAMVAGFLLATLSTYAQENALSLAHGLQYCTIRIETTKDDGRHTGTGFFFDFGDMAKTSSIPAIVTCKHLINGSTQGRLFFSVEGTNANERASQHLRVDLDNFAARWIPHPDTNTDLCVMPIVPLLREGRRQGKPLYYLPFERGLIADSSYLEVLEQVVLIGYPIGIWDVANNMPISRQGITATDPKIDYNGRAEFVIDAACFPGSSGSPVLLFFRGVDPIKHVLFAGEKVKLLGILYAGPQYTFEGRIIVKEIPTALEPKSETPLPTNLGFVIKASQLLAFEDILERLATQSKTPSR